MFHVSVYIYMLRDVVCVFHVSVYIHMLRDVVFSMLVYLSIGLRMCCASSLHEDCSFIMWDTWNWMRLEMGSR